MAGSSYADVVASEPLRQMVSGYVEQLNTRLDRWETIKTWILLDHVLTVESGSSCPPSGSSARVADNHRRQIEGLYA